MEEWDLYVAFGMGGIDSFPFLQWLKDGDVICTAFGTLWTFNYPLVAKILILSLKFL